MERTVTGTSASPSTSTGIATRVFPCLPTATLFPVAASVYRIGRVSKNALKRQEIEVSEIRPKSQVAGPVVSADFRTALPMHRRAGASAMPNARVRCREPLHGTRNLKSLKPFGGSRSAGRVCWRSSPVLLCTKKRVLYRFCILLLVYAAARSYRRNHQCKTKKNNS